MKVIYTQYDILGFGKTKELALEDAKERFDFSTADSHKYYANISTKSLEILKDCFENDRDFTFKIRYNDKSNSCTVKYG